MSKFERDTSVSEVGPGVYEGHVNRDWWIVFGPNGGFLAAMVVRAMNAAVDDHTRVPRSLTIHYTRAPAEGPVRITTTIERAGRTLTTVSARMEQGDRLIALAVAAYSTPRVAAIEFSDAPPPAVPMPEELDPVEPQRDLPPFTRQWEMRPAIGVPPFHAHEGSTKTGCWIKPHGPHPIDSAVVAQISDAWLPAVFVPLTGTDPV